ncbi:nSTAND1 domain-containing NTPase [Streptomyces yaizuensis]|uniref:Trypsin-like peptidase domain-containing protein n=1 Tax=Streptomyces yaizuensis TaxID=2989713 RepID=A0ABQ5NXP7_9ACTN|nr:trypsin-like peptidase domain-containing protein [Streptomyces sp. YSPA8]GLF95145.1 trypsin-like peptidase domain-containing protein [Streptomyces sp. YSPA8]
MESVATEPEGFRAEAAVAQIVVDGRVAGAGFLITDVLVVTCAHVVRAARSGPGDRVQLTFPRASGAPFAEGEVLAGRWRAPDGDDVAVIRLERTPAGTGPLPMGSAAGCRGHRVRSFGFPAQAPPGGHFGYGTAGDVLPAAVGGDGVGELLQLTGANDLTQGFSGGPVIDQETGLVIGMVTAITVPDVHHRGTGIAYATPTGVLRQICPEVAERPVRPYRGLEPFTAADAAWFHGRETAVDRVLAGLWERPGALLLLGPSGAGKSSLIQAGVLPALSRGAVPGSDRWLPVLVPRPGEDLLAELDRHGLPGAGTTTIATAVHNRLAAAAGQERLILVIDQFEEFLHHPAAPSASPPPAEQLAELITSGAPVSVILIMRDDYYPQLAAFAPTLLEAVAPGLVNTPAALSRQDLRAIITRPAELARLRFEDGLAERIIADVLTRGHAPVTLLPALELVLSRLWERRQDSRLTHAAYERIGQVTGSLAAWCNSALDQLPPQQRPIARRLLTALVRPADPLRQIPATRQQVPLETLRSLASGPGADSTVDTVVSALARHRIITTYARTPGPPPSQYVAELVHDTLTRDWAELRDWAEQDHLFHTWLRRAEDQRARWEESHQSGDLLHGSDLLAGLEWRLTRGLPADTAVFVDTSRRHAQATVRRTRRLNVILAGVLVLALIAAGTAFRQRETALEERQAARTAQQAALSRQLAVQSEVVRESNPDAASLLAVQAYRASPTAEATARLYHAAATPLRRVVAAGDGPMGPVVFGPDGRHVLAAGGGRLRSWNTGTGRSRVLSTGMTANTRFSADGRTAVDADQHGTTRVWDTGTGRLRSVFNGHALPPGRQDDSGIFPQTGLSADGRFLVVTSLRGQYVWDVRRKPVLVLALRDRLGFWAGLSPDGSMIAVETEESTILWDVSRRRAGPLLSGRPGPTRLMRFSPDSRTLAGISGKRIRLWEVGSGRLLASLPYSGNFDSEVSFSPDGRILAVPLDNGSIQLWDIPARQTMTTFIAHSEQMSPVSFSADGRLMAAVDRDNRIRIWDTPTGSIRRMPGLLGISPDGRTAVIGDEDAVDLLDIDSGSRKARLTLPSGHTLDGTAFSGNGQNLATGSSSRERATGSTVRLWDTGTGRIRREFTVGAEARLAISPDGRQIALSSDGRTVHLRDSTTGRINATLTGYRGDAPRDLRFSPDGTRLMARFDTPARSTTHVWDARTGRRLGRLATHQGEPHGVVFSPDSRTLAAGTSDDRVALWSADTGRLLATLSGNTAYATSVAFSPDGRTLATGSLRTGIILWDLTTRRTRFTLPGHESDVVELAFSPDGRTLTSRAEDETVRVHPITFPGPAESIRIICQAHRRDFTPEERATFSLSPSSRPVCPPARQPPPP